MIIFQHTLLMMLKICLQDDDSDLEYDLEAFPSISTEASAEATACVKVSDINCTLFKGFFNRILIAYLLSVFDR